jgi:hypothetical protein
MKRVIDPHFKDVPCFNSISKALLAHEKKISKKSVNDLTDIKTYRYHTEIIMEIGQHYMDLENSVFNIDENNKLVIRFMLYYFNHCKLAEDVFPEKNYKLHKNIILAGEPGTGKTLLMQIFSDYLKIINSGLSFQNLSVTQMMNYYKINSHIDKFTFNEIDSKSREGSPFHICMNDIGIDTQNQKHFGTSGQLVIDEFLFARYEVYQSQRMNYHITTNMDLGEFKKHFEGRLIDRFKSFNLIPLVGKSRRK